MADARRAVVAAAVLCLLLGASASAVAGPSYWVHLGFKQPQWGTWLPVNLADDTPATEGPQASPASIDGGWRRWFNSVGQYGGVVDYGKYSVNPSWGNASTWAIASSGPDQIEGTMYSGAARSAFAGAMNYNASQCQHEMIIDDVVFTNTGFAGTEFMPTLNLHITFQQTLDQTDSNGLPLECQGHTNSVKLDVSGGLRFATFNPVVTFTGDHAGESQFIHGGVPLTFDVPHTLNIRTTATIESMEGTCGDPVIASRVVYTVRFGSPVFDLPAGITVNSVQGNIVNNVWTPPPACAGDITGDGTTNSADFNVLASSFGSSVAPNTNGDLTGDGVVNSADFNILAGDFGCGA